MDDKSQLISVIAEQVLKVLGQRGITPAAPPPPEAYLPQAVVNAPVGMCTAGGSKSVAVPSQGEVLKGIITARSIEEVKGGVIRIASGARFSPLAKDLIKDKGLTVQCVSDVTGGLGASAQNNRQLLWWADGRCDGVAKVTSQLNHQLTPVSYARHESALVEVIKDLAKRVAPAPGSGGNGSGGTSGGVLFVSSAARAVCFANRCKSLRAIVGTCEKSVEQGIKQLNPNVLIIEYPYHNVNSMRGMVMRFIDGVTSGRTSGGVGGKTSGGATSGGGSVGEIDRQLKELAACV